MILLARCARLYSLITLASGAIVACSSSSDGEKTTTSHQAFACGGSTCDGSQAPPPPPDPYPDPPPSSGDPGGGGGGGDPDPVPYCSTGEAFTQSCSGVLTTGSDTLTKCAREAAMAECQAAQCYDTTTQTTRAFSCESGLGRCTDYWWGRSCTVIATGH